MKLLSLPNGHLSGEFPVHQWSKVKARLKRYGEVASVPMADMLVITVANARFVRTDEWDGAALIATNAAGDTMLRAVAARTRLFARPRIATVWRAPSTGRLAGRRQIVRRAVSRGIPSTVAAQLDD